MGPMVLHELGRGPVPQAPLSGQARTEPSLEETALVDAVEVYHRTYTTILRSSGETQLRVFEHSHKAMGSSLHPLAAAMELDLGALLYAVRRLPDAIFRARLVIMGQSAEVFAQRGFRPFNEWTEVSAPGRRRRWYDDGDGTLAVLIASASDVDDLIPTMVALQIEVNKLKIALKGTGIEHVEEATPGELAAACGGLEDDWLQLYEIWAASFGARLAQIAEHGMALRVRMLGGTQVGFARVTRRWWQQVTGLMRSESLLDRPVYFVSSNSHAIANLLTGVAPRHADELAAAVDRDGGGELRDELQRFRDGTATGALEQLPVLRGARAAPAPARLRTSGTPTRGARSGLVERDQPDRARCRRPGHPTRPRHARKLR